MKAFIDGKRFNIEDRSMIKDWVKAFGLIWCLIALAYFIGRLL